MMLHEIADKGIREGISHRINPCEVKNDQVALIPEGFNFFNPKLVGQGAVCGE